MSSPAAWLQPNVAAPRARSGAYGLMPTYGGGIASEYARKGKLPSPRYASRASASMRSQGSAMVIEGYAGASSIATVAPSMSSVAAIVDPRVRRDSLELP